ncbi:MAG: FlgD immunoglobulin-like domain containing protein [Candidatus Latescibacterota bacterium]
MIIRSKILLGAFLGCFLLTGAATAWEGFLEWERVSPPLYGGCVTAIATDPADKDVIYAGTDGGGLFKSEDGARTWVRRAIAAGLVEESVYQIVIDPQNSNRIFAVTSDGFFMSSDAGDTWRDSTPKGTFVPIPNSMLLLDGVPEVILLSTENKGIFRSENEGASWENVYRSLRRTAGLMGNPLKKSQIFAVAEEVVGPYQRPELPRLVNQFIKSDDSGRHWEPITLMYSEFSGLPSFKIAPWGDFYLSIERQGVYRSADEGATWAIAYPDAGMQHGPRVWTAPDSTRTIFLTEEGRVKKCRADGARRHTVLETENDDWVRSMDRSKYSDGQILIGLNDHGLWKSEDYGESWFRSDRGIQGAEVKRIVPAPNDPNTFFVLFEDGLYATQDGGRTWHATEPPFRGNGSVHFNAMAIDPFDSRHVLVAADGLYRSGDGGKTWQEASYHIGEAQPTVFSDVKFNPVDSKICFAIGRLKDSHSGDYSTDVLKSEDGGATWELVELGMDLVSPLGISFDPSDEKAVYLSQASEKFPLVRSTDNGRMWFPLSSYLLENGEHQPCYLSSAPVIADDGPIYKFYGMRRVGYQIVRSRDGLEWETVPFEAEGYQPGALSLNPLQSGALSLDPLQSGVIYVLAFKYERLGQTVEKYRSQIWRSSDAGQHWRMEDFGLKGAEVLSWACSSDGLSTTLFAGAKSGLYRSRSVTRASSGGDLLLPVWAYPNPSGSEVWIGFGLTGRARVRARIFTSAGELVKTLDIGEVEAGSHREQEEAIHWDGANEAGFLVGSGVYFCVVEADGDRRICKLAFVRP